MADENKPEGGSQQQPTEGAGSGQQPTDPQGGNNGQQPDKKPDAGGQQQPAEGAQDPNKAQEDEPKVRKTQKDYIIERIQRQRDKARKDAANPDGGKKPTGDDGNQGGSDDDIDPEDEAKISKVLDKRLGPVMDELDAERQQAAEQQEEAELQTFLTECPQFKPYEAKIRKWAKHESRKNLPLLSIAYEIAGPDLERIGAERERKAAQDAAASATGGGSTRTESPKKPIPEMTKEEFRDLEEKARRGEIVIR
ncbi:MAG: hypothetical protein PHC53_02615 [Patescibacteria group bacterium]|nr:hypothetical protein [Patescibacteria group bacterium]